MTKFALLKQFSFGLTDESENQNQLNNKITFDEFDSTLNLFNKMHEIFGNNMIEVQNCSYDDKYLIQAFFIEDNECLVHNNIILVKRQINQNDSYTYIGFLENDKRTDNFIYVDIEISDIEKILKRKSELSYVIVKTNGEIENVKCKVEQSDQRDQIGKITIIKHNNQKKTFKFLNIPSLCNSEANNKSENVGNMITEKIEKMTMDNKLDFYYSQHSFCMGLLNCYSPIFGTEPNNKISKLFGNNFYGDILIGLENNLNDEERLLDIDDILFSKIEKIFSNQKFNRKNELFCNLYYELA